MNWCGVKNKYIYIYIEQTHTQYTIHRNTVEIQPYVQRYLFLFLFFIFIFSVLWGLNFRIRTDIYAQTNSKQLGKKGNGECVEGQLLVFTCQLLWLITGMWMYNLYTYTYTYSIQRLIKIVKSHTLHIGFTFLETETFFFICEKKMTN